MALDGSAAFARSNNCTPRPSHTSSNGHVHAELDECSAASVEKTLAAVKVHLRAHFVPALKSKLVGIAIQNRATV